MKQINMLLMTTALGLLSIGCSKSTTTNDTTGKLTLNLKGLEPLGDKFEYEGWLIIDGKSASTGTFDVDKGSTTYTKLIEIPEDSRKRATKFVLTIEPDPDKDIAPSKTKILGGEIKDGKVALGIVGYVADKSFDTAAGKYFLATPTDGNADMNETSGVWWLDPASKKASLTLPVLKDGWKYEGWVVVNGTPVSTGTFTSVSGADAAKPHSGDTSGPLFPGEDLLKNAPAGVVFPVDLPSGGKNKVVISVEPNPDNSAAPFTIKPLVGTIATTVTTKVLQNMDKNVGAITTSTIEIE